MGKDNRGWRKLVKKLRRKKMRQKSAAEQLTLTAVESNETSTDCDHPVEVDQSIDNNFFISEQEWKEREKLFALRSMIREAEAAKKAAALLEEQNRIRKEWEEQQRKEKLEKEERERQEELRKTQQARSLCLLQWINLNDNGTCHKVYFLGCLKQEEDFNKFLDFLCGDIENPPQPYVMPENLDESKEACIQFTKTGACRYMQTCKMAHPVPVLSRTLLIPNFFSNLLLEERLRDEYESELGLQYDKSDLQKEFLEFYHDVLPEFKKHGKIIQFKVCCNFEPHLRGNVYIQFENIRNSVEAYRKFNGRYYNGKQLSISFVKIDSWRAAICWSFLRGSCLKGNTCNYLHVFRNPTKEFVMADRDWKDLKSINNERNSNSSSRFSSLSQNTDINRSASITTENSKCVSDVNSKRDDSYSKDKKRKHRRSSEDRDTSCSSKQRSHSMSPETRHKRSKKLKSHKKHKKKKHKRKKSKS